MSANIARAPVAPPAPLKGAHQSVYIWEDRGRKHNGVQIYKVGVAATHCPDGTCGVTRRMNQVARACAATPKLICHIPAHEPFKLEAELKRYGGEVPGSTDGKNDFRTFTSARLALCLDIMRKRRADGLAPPKPAVKPLPKDPRKRRAEIRKRRGAWMNNPPCPAFTARKERDTARHELYKQLAEEHLRINFKPGLVFNRTFEGYRGERFTPQVEAQLRAEVDARLPWEV